MTVPLSPIVKVGGTAIAQPDQKALIEVRIERQMNLPGRCVLRYAARELADVGHKTEPGSVVEVTAPDGKPMFSGEIIAVEVERGSEAKPTLTFVCYDKANRLSFTGRTRTWQKATLQTILTDVVKPSGLSLKGTALPTDQNPYILQAGTDLELLDALTVRSGTEWWASGSDLVVRKPSPGGGKVLKTPLKDLLRFGARASANRPSRVVVRGWDSVKQQPIEGSSEYSQATPPAKGAIVDKYVKAPFAAREHSVSSMPVETASEAKTLATALVERGAAGATHADGEGVGLTSLDLGDTVEVTDGGSLTGSYVVTGLQHWWAPGQAIRTRFVSGERRPDLLNGSSGIERVDTYGGVVVGEVTNINDPDKRGRVRVRFLGLTTQEESNWARVLTVGAGADRGAVNLPEVKDEVLVAFEAGDLRRPVVLGGLFGSTNKIPLSGQVENGKVAARRSTSRLGHHLEFGDGTSPDKEHILLSFKDGKTKLRLGKDKVDLLAPDNVPVTIQAGGQSSIKFDGKGNITIQGVKIEIKATQELTASGNSKVELKATGQLKASGATAEVTATGQAKVSATGPLQLQGAVVKIN